MKRFLLVLWILILMLPIVLTGRLSAKTQVTRELTSSEQQLLELVARREQIPVSELELLNSSTVRFSLTGQVVSTGKVFHDRSDQVFSITANPRGEEVSFEVLQREEDRAYSSRYGKYDPVLFDRLQQLSSNDSVRVAFWANQSDDLEENDIRVRLTDPTSAEVESYINRRQQEVAASVALSTRELAAAIERAGLQVEASSNIAPLVYTTVPVNILSRFSDRADVQRIYLAENVNGDYMNVAAPSINANSVWAAGISGQGSKIAIIEDSRVDFDNNCLAVNLGTRVPGDPNVDNHATSTAGMAASTNAVFRGIAFGAGIYSANGTTYSDSNMSKAIDAGASNTHISNNSWGPQCGFADGTMNVHARHSDYIVRYLWDTVTAAAGNNGTCGGFEYVGGIATGYNVIAVGNFDDKGTVALGDNTMNPGSSYKDPISPHNDREKPEVAAPGTNITSLVMAAPGTCPTGNVGSGTSYSSPMVAGLVGLLMEAKPILKICPEGVKSLVLAGAVNNIEGSARLSEFDGAGGVNAFQSYNSAINNRFKWMKVTPASFDASGYITINMGAVAPGARVKVALVWDSNPKSDYTTDPLEADLDLRVSGPGGFVQWSASWDNSYEIVDFTAPGGGVYTIKIKNFKFTGASENVAVAWVK